MSDQKVIDQLRRAAALLCDEIETPQIREAIDAIDRALGGADERTAEWIIEAARLLLRGVRRDLEVRLAAPRLAIIEQDPGLIPATGKVH